MANVCLLANVCECVLQIRIPQADLAGAKPPLSEQAPKPLRVKMKQLIPKWDW